MSENDEIPVADLTEQDKKLLAKAIYIEQKSLGVIDILTVLREAYYDGYEQGSKSVSGLRGD